MLPTFLNETTILRGIENIFPPNLQTLKIDSYVLFCEKLEEKDLEVSQKIHALRKAIWQHARAHTTFLHRTAAFRVLQPCREPIGGRVPVPRVIRNYVTHTGAPALEPNRLSPGGFRGELHGFGLECSVATPFYEARKPEYRNRCHRGTQSYLELRMKP